jgi:hypothetical protein
MSVILPLSKPPIIESAAVSLAGGGIVESLDDHEIMN